MIHLPPFREVGRWIMIHPPGGRRGLGFSPTPPLRVGKNTPGARDLTPENHGFPISQDLGKWEIHDIRGVDPVRQGCFS